MSGGERWLLLGASGFIGSWTKRAAEEAGVTVLGASRTADGELACDLADKESVDRVVAIARPHRIIAAAGPPSVARSWAEPADTFRCHALGVSHLLESARRHVPEAHLTLLSSAEVYGSSDEDMREDSPIEPLTPYGAAKAAMEIIAEQHARAHGTQLAILRPFNQIGPGLAPGHAIVDFATAVATAENEGAARAKVAVGNPDAVRDYTDVRDSAAAIVKVATERLAGIFNLCSGRSTSTRDLIAALAEAAAVPVDLELDPSLARPADPARKVGRPDRLAVALGWRAETPLRRTIADILASARAAGEGSPDFGRT